MIRGYSIHFCIFHFYPMIKKHNNITFDVYVFVIYMYGLGLVATYVLSPAGQVDLQLCESDRF